ncbi:MAG: T9SS type A sorting domain-containing protein, partial [Bacteroidia bacterium]|nr:T9SS type A sorting domain-containing protein [Bacteroidia bacterium]
ISISGSSTYTYIWSPVANSTASVSALPAGTYTCTISDTGLCTIPFKVTITQPAAIGNNTITGAQTICSGSSPTALIGLTPTGEDSTNYAYSWLSSTTNATSGFVLASGTNNTQNYTPGSLSQDTWFKRVVNSGTCASDTSAAVLILINTTPQIVNQPVSGYSKSDSGAFVVKATGGALTYQWQKKTNGAWNDMSPFSFLEYSGANSDSLTLTAFFLSLNQIYFSDFMNGFYRCKISNACSSVYTDSVSLTTYTSVWTGGVDNNWNNNANWLYGETPSANQNIVVRSSAIYNPIVSGNVTINHLVIETGKNCSLNSNTDSLIINGDITGTGTYNGSKGTSIFRNTSPQFIPSGTYYNIAIQNSVFALLHGNVIIKNNITAPIPLRIQFELLIDSNATYNIAVVKTEGAQSKLTIRNIGTGGRTGAVIFPVGATTTYNNPVTITNIGIADAFSVTLRDSVTNNYSGLIPIGAKINTNAVNRTWIINEETAGGSNATITLQWNAGDELSGFNRAASYISKHTAYGWMPNATVAASGTNPYTQTITGVTTFAPFGVGSSGALPVQLISFQAVKINQSVNLNWTTATEINNDYFIIERSIDGKLFEEITSVKGKGNSTSPSSYLYVDADVQNIATVNNTTTLFYRLKQVDIDGKTDLSEVITINTDELNSTDITLQPNPSANQTAIIIHSAKAQQTEIQIKDITGNSISTQNAALIIGKNNIPLQGIEGLNEGIYIVIIKQGHQINTLKLVIKH